MADTPQKKILLMAGGTGGHVFPALALAKMLQQHGYEIHWLGTEKGLEARLVPDAKIPLHTMTIGGVRGKGWRTRLMAPWRLMQAIMQARRIIRAVNPCVIVGFGGFASGPGGIAAILLRKKLVIHEQNAKPGLTNQWLALGADRVLEGFPQTFTRRSHVVTTGNPVRAEIAQVQPLHAAPEKSRALRILVLGGSLGAQALNETIPATVSALKPYYNLDIWHQTGEKQWAETEAYYQKLQLHARVEPFIQAMDQAYQWADMVICRAGALTIAELCAAGRGAILIPYPHAVDDHQTANAQYMVKNNAAYLLPQSMLSVERLAELLTQLLQAPEEVRAMSQAAYQLRRADATAMIGQICEEISL